MPAYVFQSKTDIATHNYAVYGRREASKSQTES